MGSILMVVADVLGHEPFQVSLVQDNHVIEQVSSATTDPTFRDPVLPGTTKGSCPSPLIKAYLEPAYSERSLLTDVNDCHLPTLKIAIALHALAA